MSKEIKKPAFAKQLGHIRVAVWLNEVEGRTFYNTAITRQYLDKKSDQWQEATSFNGQSDLVLVREAVRLAAEWVDAHERSEGLVG
jgi:hypothetical protein